MSSVSFRPKRGLRMLSAPQDAPDPKCDVCKGSGISHWWRDHRCKTVCPRCFHVCAACEVTGLRRTKETYSSPYYYYDWRLHCEVCGGSGLHVDAVARALAGECEPSEVTMPFVL